MSSIFENIAWKYNSIIEKTDNMTPLQKEILQLQALYKRKEQMSLEKDIESYVSLFDPSNENIMSQTNVKTISVQFQRRHKHNQRQQLPTMTMMMMMIMTTIINLITKSNDDGDSFNLSEAHSLKIWWQKGEPSSSEEIEKYQQKWVRWWVGCRADHSTVHVECNTGMRTSELISYKQYEVKRKVLQLKTRFCSAFRRTKLWAESLFQRNGHCSVPAPCLREQSPQSLPRHPMCSKYLLKHILLLQICHLNKNYHQLNNDLIMIWLRAAEQ